MKNVFIVNKFNKCREYSVTCMLNIITVVFVFGSVDIKMGLGISP
jgi:hypothetical protein